jgi:hypothetical protein
MDQQQVSVDLIEAPRSDAAVKRARLTAAPVSGHSDQVDGFPLGDTENGADDRSDFCLSFCLNAFFPEFSFNNRQICRGIVDCVSASRRFSPVWIGLYPSGF